MELKIDPQELKSIVAEVVAEAQGCFGDNDRVAYVESEAAELLGIRKHVLRDERLRGRIKPGKSGRNWLYSRKMLVDYVEINEAE